MGFALDIACLRRYRPPTHLKRASSRLGEPWSAWHGQGPSWSGNAEVVGEARPTEDVGLRDGGRLDPRRSVVGSRSLLEPGVCDTYCVSEAQASCGNCPGFGGGKGCLPRRRM